jgi:protein-tyrosine phosphatase
VRVVGSDRGMGGRSLGLVNAANARDLGGYPTVDGRRVRRGLLYRASALNRLSDAEVDLVAGLGLSCLIDFRHPREIEMVGADRLPAPPPVRLESLPLFDPDHDVFTAVSLVLAGKAGPEVLTMLDGDGAVQAMHAIYRWFVRAPLAGQTFGAVLRMIASGDPLPLLFHCTAGKDRTGWLSVLLLRVLGVPPDLVRHDYLLTNTRNAASVSVLLDRAGRRLPDPNVLLPLLQAREDYLDAGLVEVDRAYGSFDRYLDKALGLDAGVLDGLRALLVE